MMKRSVMHVTLRKKKKSGNFFFEVEAEGPIFDEEFGEDEDLLLKEEIRKIYIFLEGRVTDECDKRMREI